MSENRAACFCLHDDWWFLHQSIRSVKVFGQVFAFVSKLAWNGTPGEWKRVAEIAKTEGATVLLGEWPDEQLHRKSALAALKEKGYQFILTPDGDEVLEPELVEHLKRVAEQDLGDRVHVHMDTYWKSAEYVIRPREALTPLMLLNVDRAEHVYIREYTGGRRLILDADYGVMHHLSYAGPDERIQRKISTWGHKAEVVPDWYDRAWKGWDGDKLMRNLHPTHPPAFGFAERIPIPEILRCPNPQKAKDKKKKPSAKAETSRKTPMVSVVIPLHGNPEDIRLCLESLAKFQDLLHEVIVIDNASSDGAEKVAESFGFVTLIRNKENLGFAKASNQGLAKSSGDIVLFLNSDTVVPRAGFERLIEALTSSASFGAAGPFTNECGHSQKVLPTYTSIERLDLFAEDFAARELEDTDAPSDMLVGFCLAVRKSILDEIGGFDESFGHGLFEDNDLCYRIRRAGFRLVLARRAYIHHFGSQTISKMGINPWRLMEENERRYRRKWQDDIETGFASHLAGFVEKQIVFDPNRSPERRCEAIRAPVRQAKISLCMIVKNEERVLAECLRSAKPFFTQMVVVDTGSTDRTAEIAKGLGAEVYHTKWKDSFAEARNESLRHAKGDWIFWVDADDTLPWVSGEEVVHSARSAPKDIVGFVAPVQFVEKTARGTRVDHVKLFRNIPGLKWEGRIHEQILMSLRQTGGGIARCNAVVMHTNYDSSPEGQRQKRLRDAHLLKLDYEDFPGHPFKSFNLGMTDHYNGEHVRAIEWLQKSIDLSAEGESHLRKAYALMAVSQRELGLTGEALSTVYRGLKAVGEDPELHFHAGKLLAEGGRFEEAKQHYLAIQEDIADHFSSIDMAILTTKRYHNLAQVYLQSGDYPSAREWWLKALASDPGFLPSATELFGTALDVGDFAAAQKVMDPVLSVTGMGEQWSEMAAAYHDRLVGRMNTDRFLLDCVHTEPNRTGPRLILARRWLAEGREGEAYPHLQELVRRGCAEGAYLLGVVNINRGDLGTALFWMEQAQMLNPEHEGTAIEIDKLRHSMATKVTEP